jgi:hypothetical protein
MTHRKNQQGIADYSLLKGFIEPMSLSSLYELRGIITSAIRNKKHNRNASNLTYRKYFDLDSIDERIKTLLEDDWGNLFRGCVDDRSDYYVYAHIDPLTLTSYYSSEYLLKPIIIPTPIYIGMGVDDRWKNFKRSKLHTKKLSFLSQSGFQKCDIATKIDTGLTLSEAMELESKLIMLFGCKGSSDGSLRAYIGESPCLFNQQYEPIPSRWMNSPCCHSQSVGY